MQTDNAFARPDQAPITENVPEMLDGYRDAVAAGASLHWLKVKAKNPVQTGWSTCPNKTWATLTDTFVDGYNIGLRPGLPSKTEAGYIHVIDLDITDSSKAEEAYAALAGIAPGYEKLPTVISGSGGESRHYYFVSPEPLRGSVLAASQGFSMVWSDAKGREVKKNDWQIELLGTGSNCVIPPSIHPDSGKSYRWLKEFPWDELDLGIGPTVRLNAVTQTAANSNFDPDDDLLSLPLGLTQREIRKHLNAYSNDDDYSTWVAVGMAVHHETQGSEVGRKLFHFWSQKSTKYDPKNTEEKWKRGFKDEDNLKRRPKTMRSIIKAVSEIKEIQRVGTVEEYNRKYAVVPVGGKVLIAHERGENVDLYPWAEFAKLVAPERVKVGDEEQQKSEIWFYSDQRRFYPDGLTFNPKPGDNGGEALNLWRGWTVQPDPNASCALFLDHLRNIICNGNDDHYQWLIRWMAHFVQKPHEKPGTAIVMRGVKGAGKDTLAEYLGAMCKKNWAVFDKPGQLTGKFNLMFERLLIANIQEAVWAGDKTAEGTLRSLITNPEMQIERKGVDAIKMPNFTRFIYSSNESWVVPATGDERRFFVLDASEARRGDDAYFNELYRALEKENAAGALMHHLMQIDLEGYNLRLAPMTEGLRDQARQSLRGVDAWWLEMLTCGDLECRSGDPLSDDEPKTWEAGAITILKDDLYRRYEEWLKGERFEKREGSSYFYTKLGRIVPFEETKPRQDGRRVRVWTLPPLSECITTFASKTGVRV